MDELEEVRLEFLPQELETIIKKHYLTLNENIKEIKVDCKCYYISGTYDFSWQREIGGGYNFEINIKIVREILALGNIKTINNNFTLNKNDVEKILQSYLKKDDLIIDFICLSIDGKTIDVRCHKNTISLENIKEKNIEITYSKFPNNIINSIYQLSNDIIDKTQKTLKKVLKI